MSGRGVLRGLLLLLVLGSGCWGREGVPVELVWDYALTMPATDVVTHFQLQRCTATGCATTWTFCAVEDATCTFTGTKRVRYGDGTTFVERTATTSIACTNAVFGDPLVGVIKHCDTQEIIAACVPTDVLGAVAAVGESWGTAVATGTWAADNTLKTASFTAQSARYVKLVATSEANGNPYAAAAEIRVFNNGVVIAPGQMVVVSADSQEFQGDAGAVQHVLDGDTTTFWHTGWFSSTPPYPHTVILDLGATYTQVDSLTYLPRQNQSNGLIAGYEVYLATTLSGSWTDTLVEGGVSYIYQALAIGIVNEGNTSSVASAQVCTYVRAAHRGRPDVIVDK